MKILVFGIPGSGKTTLAKPFAELIDAVYVNDEDIRSKYDEWNTKSEILLPLYQSKRLCYIADGIVMSGRIAVIDSVCPLHLTREYINPDYSVWMDTLEEKKYSGANVLFHKPELNIIDYHVAQWFDDTHAQLADVVSNYMRKKENNKEKL